MAKPSAMLAAFLCPIVAAAAGITNGEFETGDLDGWTVFTFDPRSELTHSPPEFWGYAAAVGAQTSYPPLAGAYSALLAAMDNRRIPDCSIDPFNTTCASYPPTGVPATPPGGPALAYPPFLTPSYNGAYIGQDFTAAAGDLLAWTWKWGGDGMDKMFASLTDGEAIFYIEGRALAWIYAEIEPATGHFLDYQVTTGLAPGQTWDAAFRIPSDGLWTIYFGIAQTGDNQGSSWMQLDNVRVPEPAPAALLLAGLFRLVTGLRAIRR